MLSLKNQQQKFSFLLNGPVLAFVFLTAFLLYWACSNIFFIGYFVDDSAYILSAQFLFGKKLDPLLFSLNDYHLGFPLLIAPVVKIFGPISTALKFPSILFSLASGWVFYKLIKNNIKEPFACIGLTFFILHPVVVRYSGTVMTEPLFILLSLLIIYLIDLDENQPKWATIFLMAYLCATRPTGILLLFSVAVYGLLSKGKKTYLFQTAIALMLFIGFKFFMNSFSNEGVSYMTHFSRYFQNFLTPTIYLSNIKKFLGLAIPGTFLQLPPIPFQPWRSLVAYASIFFVLGVIVKGGLGSRRPAIKISLIYVFITLLTIPLWLLIDARYALTLLPFMAFLFFKGLVQIPIKPNLEKPIKYGLIIFLGFCLIWGNSKNFMDSFNPKPSHRFPENTFQYLKNITEGKSAVLYESAQTLYIYTGIPSVRMFSYQDKTDLLEKLKKRNVRYVLLKPGIFLDGAPMSLLKSIPQRIKNTVRTEPEFKKIYENKIEHLEIYQVLHSKEG